MVDAAGLGYLGTLVAVFFFGSNYLLTKGHNLGDGISFQFLMSIGILSIGYITISMNNGDLLFVPLGILGGSLWACGNALVTPIIRCIGLGLGFLLWCSGNMIFGWFIGTFGLFGVEKEVVASPALNVFGVIFGFLSLLCYLFIDPSVTLEKLNSGAGSRDSHLESSHHERHVLLSTQSLIAPSSAEKSGRSSKTAGGADASIFDRLDPYPKLKMVVGCAMGIGAGLLYSLSFVPFTVWHGSHKDAAPAAFAFSHYSGIFLCSLGIFLVYGAFYQGFKKEMIFLMAPFVQPSFYSGVMWAIANTGFFYSQAGLGYTIGTPLVSIGPGVISSLFAYFKYGEMQGKRNTVLLVTSFVCVGIAVMFLVLSRSQ